MLALYAMLAYGTVATDKAKKAQKTLRDKLEDSGALRKSRETWKVRFHGFSRARPGHH